MATIPPNPHFWIATNYRNEGVPVGAIGYFQADRCDTGDSFIVVDVDAKSGWMSIIFPRIRLTPTGQLEFGQDRLIEPPFERVKTCHCPPPVFHDEGCFCSWDKDNNAAYDQTFQVAPKDQRYKVLDMKFFTVIGPYFDGNLEYIRWRRVYGDYIESIDKTRQLGGG